jgi:Immunity protein 27
MKKIDASETRISGRIVLERGKIIWDITSQRIFDLVNGYLIKIGHDDSGWDTLYRDPNDNRLWELVYAESELQGGGPPSLNVISQDVAALKYKIDM